ncbi:MAG: hypothetical protein LBF97_06285 [Elusimicrobiota bacterium]|jgi:hypothetical protein|nr:hypothetical protein [Elusimicrobiota bacterium]
MIANKTEQYVLNKGIEWIVEQNFKYVIQILNFNGDVLGETRQDNVYYNGITCSLINNSLVWTGFEKENTIVIANGTASFVRIYILESNIKKQLLFTLMLYTPFDVKIGDKFTFDFIAFDRKDTVYTKIEVDGLIPDISGKADVNTVYTKTETDNAILSAIEDIPETDLSGYYTKIEVDNLVGDIAAALDAINGEEV